MKLNPGIYFCKITYSLHFELYRKLNSYLKWHSHSEIIFEKASMKSQTPQADAINKSAVNVFLSHQNPELSMKIVFPSCGFSVRADRDKIL